MKRRIIEIDQDKCNGCGACAAACHEGAIAMVDGKARLMRDDYCDGLHRLRLGVRRECGVPGGWHLPRYAMERGTGGF